MIHGLVPGKFLVIARHGGGSLGRGPDELLVLIEGLFHRCLEPLCGGHLAVELLRAAHRAQVDVIALQPAQAHAVAGMAGGQAVAEGECGREEALLLVHCRHEVERVGELLHVGARLVAELVLLIRRGRVGYQVEA